MAIPIEEIMKSVKSRISVGIEITNSSKHFDLTSPETFAKSGVVQSPPPPTIQKDTKGTCVFIKTPFSLYGCVGVLSYSFGSQQISLLFSNPFNCIRYDTKLALHITDTITTTDHNLWTNMRSQLIESDSFTKTDITNINIAMQVFNEVMEVSATMSNVNTKAIIKLEVRDRSSAPSKPNN